MIWIFLYIAVIALILLLWGFEIKTWVADRKLANHGKTSRNRFLRRSLGLLLLITVLILLRYPAQSNLSPLLLLAKFSICLLICIFLMLLVIWDSRLILHNMREQSAQDLRALLDESGQLGTNSRGCDSDTQPPSPLREINSPDGSSSP